MNLWFLFFTFVAQFALSEFLPYVSPHRSVLNFAAMVNQVTGRNPLDYVNYGNWCGLGGGGQPLDEVDKCCQIHDWCYSVSMNQAVCTQGTFQNLAAYIYNYEWNYNGTFVVCSTENRECQQILCECDKKCAECMATNTYNSYLKKQ